MRELIGRAGAKARSVVVLALCMLAGCSEASKTQTSPTPVVAEPLTPAAGVPGDPNAGRTLFMARGCGGCHSLNALPQANGVAGPRLDNTVVRPTISGTDVPTTPANLAQWIANPASLKPGSDMPASGVTPDEARDLASFLYSLPANP
jgi:cytochrome c1